MLTRYDSFNGRPCVLLKTQGPVSVPKCSCSWRLKPNFGWVQVQFLLVNSDVCCFDSLLRKPSKIASFCHTSSIFHHLSGFHPYLFDKFSGSSVGFIRAPPRIGGEHLRGHRLPPPCGLRGGLLCRPRSGGAVERDVRSTFVMG